MRDLQWRIDRIWWLFRCWKLRKKRKVKDDVDISSTYYLEDGSTTPSDRKETRKN